MKKLYINLGLPKTGSTNFQNNFYPLLKNINYLGKSYKKYQKSIKDLSSYIEAKDNYSQDKIEKLKKDFLESLSSNTNLISIEDWVTPYQFDQKLKKIAVIPYQLKLKILISFLDSLEIEYEFFIIERRSINAHISFFIEIKHRIEKIFGIEYSHISNFFFKYNSEDKDFKNIDFFFDTFSIKTLKKFLPKGKLKIFKFSDLKENSDKFAKKVSDYLSADLDRKDVIKLRQKERITPKIKGLYFVSVPNKFFLILKKYTPTFLQRNKFLIQLFIFIKFFFLKK